MRVEAWPEAAKSFQAGDRHRSRSIEDAYYGLGLANMRMKKYGDAIGAYVKCRDLYREHGGQAVHQPAGCATYRHDRLTEIDEIDPTVPDRPSDGDVAGPPASAARAAARNSGIHLARQQHDVENSVPAFVYLALGSAYFRTEQLADAEREYKAAIAVEPKARREPSTTSPSCICKPVATRRPTRR